MHTVQIMKLISTQNVYEKTEKKKGPNYFNKTSKQSKFKIKVIDTSRCHVPVTDFVKSSKNLQHSNTPIGNLTSEMEVKLKLQLKSLLEKSTFATFFQIYEDFIKDLTREFSLRAYVFVFGKT